MGYRRIVDSVVIGAGQAGLAAAYELKRRGVDFLVYDSNEHPGGAWQHRWESLTMADVHGVADLPGSVAPKSSGEPSNRVIPKYFAAYEREHGLPVLHGVRVHRVENGGPADSREGNLILFTSVGEVFSRTIVNATGTWQRPFVPYYPGMGSFLGEHFHTVTYPGAEHFSGKRTLVVGAGASAVQFLGELASVTEVLWATRRPPQWVQDSFDGLRAVRWVEERTFVGDSPASVVSSTGLFLRPQEALAEEMGVYRNRLPMFSAVQPDGVRWDDGRWEQVDAILWATGFRPAIAHLAPLRLRSARGGIALHRVNGDVQAATTTRIDPRVHMVGYGPSASTIGSRHAARAASRAVREYVDRKG